MSSAGDRGDPHSWNSLENYILIHDKYMQQFVDEGFVVSHDLEPVMVGQPLRLTIKGRIRCPHGLFIARSYPGHADAHHRHRFDHNSWQPIEPPVWVGREGWPHLSDAIAELRTWWEEIGRFLDLSEPEIT